MTSHMKKKKAKRYQEGGEAEDKKRGLAASNKEGSVGFFERLRMGNIDDPKSEAYKRFGAGRGKAETRAQLDSAKESSQAGRYGTMKRGGVVKSSAPKMGKVKTAKPSMGGASKRADGIAMRGKTKGRMV
jgi:hypothetical protein